jgi:2-polyprenyl-3-methyl-5-hydroxy-6-metoxy-1,4-benzoquinol methylase
MSDFDLFTNRTDCLICNASQPKVLRNTPFTESPVWDFLERYYGKRIKPGMVAGADFEVAQCQNCNFIWQAQILNDNGMEKLYNEWISAGSSLNNKEKTDISLYAGYARQVEAVEQLLRKKQADITMLDYGMGWGHWCRMAAAYGFEVYGFEIATERLSYAREFGLQVTDRLSDLADIKFDFINSEQVFEHLPAPLEIFSFLVSRLKKGGIFRISVPNGSNIAQAVQQPNWKPSHDAIHPLEHINCFTNPTLLSLAQGHGLKLAQQPRLFGQGLLGKSYGVNLKSWLTSLFGRYYRRYLGTTLYFQLSEQ